MADKERLWKMFESSCAGDIWFVGHGEGGKEASVEQQLTKTRLGRKRVTEAAKNEVGNNKKL